MNTLAGPTHLLGIAALPVLTYDLYARWFSQIRRIWAGFASGHTDETNDEGRKRDHVGTPPRFEVTLKIQMKTRGRSMSGHDVGPSTLRGLVAATVGAVSLGIVSLAAGGCSGRTATATGQKADLDTGETDPVETPAVDTSEGTTLTTQGLDQDAGSSLDTEATQPALPPAMPGCEDIHVDIDFSVGSGSATVYSGSNSSNTKGALRTIATEVIEVEGTRQPNPPEWPVAPEAEWDRSRTPAGACTVILEDLALGCFDPASHLLMARSETHDRRYEYDVAMSFAGRGYECSVEPGCPHSFPDWDNWFYLEQEGTAARLVLCGRPCPSKPAVLSLHVRRGQSKCPELTP